jgi:hypothetical protein
MDWELDKLERQIKRLRIARLALGCFCVVSFGLCIYLEVWLAAAIFGISAPINFYMPKD